MAINTKKVIVGGLVAGIVMFVCDFVTNMMFGAQMKESFNTFKPGLGDAMATMTTGMMVGYFIMDLVIGMLLAYTYAAMRPRFGAGPKTSIIAALIFWIFGTIVATNYLVMGMMSRSLWLTFGVVYLVCLVIAALVAGALYSEDATATA